MSVRFIHTADLHLGSPLRTVGAESERLRETLERATYTAFERIVDVAIEEAVDFVVVAGDIYDQDSRSVRANEFVQTQFARLADEDIPAYVIYGNHDPIRSGLEFFELPDNVYEFPADDATGAVFPSPEAPRARLWGQSYRESTDGRAMYYGYTPADQSLPNVGILHTGLDPDADRYVPCSQSDLESKTDIHYWALGHIHDTRVLGGEQPIVFPGIPQGRQINEDGVGGCILVELGTDGEPAMEFVPTSSIVWQRIQIAIDGETREGSDAEAPSTVPELEDHVRTHLDRASVGLGDLAADLGVEIYDGEWLPDGRVCRVELVGRGPAHELLDEDEEVLDRLLQTLRRDGRDRQPFVWIETIRDHTRPVLPDIEDVRETDDVVSTVHDVATDVRDDRDALQSMREHAGELWYNPDEYEDDRPDQLPLSDDRLEELFERASERVMDELIERRYG